MGLKDIEHTSKQIANFELIFKINGFLQKLKIGSKKIDNMKMEFNKIKNEAYNLQKYPQKYNEYFADEGFISYESMDFFIIKKAVDLHEIDNKKDAIECIKAYYSCENIEKRMIIIKYIPEFQSRMKFIELALEDYKNKRYYAVIPILLMMIDGVINDVFDKGLHSNDINLDVWDSLVVQNQGMNSIKNIFTQSRKKTRTDSISQPYRHGILHGRDLGYDTYEVALKCWVILFAIRDLVVSKKTESARHQEYIKKNESTSWKKIFNNWSALEKTKKQLSEWKPRVLDELYINTINQNNNSFENEPENIVIKYLDFWIKRNYGNMAKIEKAGASKNLPYYAGQIKNKYKDINLHKYLIVKIQDSAPAITQITVKLDLDYYGKKITKTTIVRCVYQSEDKTILIRADKMGQWYVFHDIM